MKKRTPTIPETVPGQVVEIIQRCLTLSPKGRPTATQVLAMLTSAAASTATSGAAITCPVGASGKHIFLSYRRVDSHLASLVRTALEKRGYIVFMDTAQTSGLGAGDFQAQLEDVLRNTPVLVCLLTG